MARFMRQYVHVVGRAVEVGENERRFVIRQVGAVAARGLALLGEHVEQASVEHFVNKFRRLGAEGMVHFAARGQYFLRRAVGRGVSVRKAERVVVEFRVRHAGAGILQLLQFRHHGHEIFFDLRTVGGHVLQRVADAPHADGAQGDEILITQLSCLGRAVFHQLIVQFGPVRIKPCSLGFVGGFAHGSVRILLVKAHLADGIFSAVKFDQRRGVQLFISRGEGVFLRHQLQNGRVGGLDVHLHFFKSEPAQRLLQLCAERRGQQRAVHVQLGFAQRRAVCVKKFPLGFVKRIPRIHGVADLSQGGHGGDMAAQRLKFPERLQLRLRVRRGGDARAQRRKGFPRRVKVRASVLHLFKFHPNNSFFAAHGPRLALQLYLIIERREREYAKRPAPSKRTWAGPSAFYRCALFPCARRGAAAKAPAASPAPKSETDCCRAPCPPRR